MPGEAVSKLWQTSAEQRTVVTGQVEGVIPPAIRGTYLRVGPSKFDFEAGGGSLNHFFDGYALLSKFRINEGGPGVITFESKYLDSDAYKRSMAAGKSMANEFGTKSEAEIGKGYFAKLCHLYSIIMIPNLTDNCNYGFFTHEKDTFVMGETSSFHELDVGSLSSACRHDMPRYYGYYMFTAHPLRDARTGDTYNIGTSVKTGLKHNLFRIPPKQGNISAKEHFKKNGKTIATIPSRWTTCVSWNHTFGMSENYAVFIEQPFVGNAARFLASGLVRNEPYSHWLEWHPEHSNRFYIINKRTGKVLSTELLSHKPFFFLHIINCYEDEEAKGLVLDISAYDDPSVLDVQNLEKLRGGTGLYDESAQASIRRYVLPLLQLSSSVPEGTNLSVNGNAKRVGKSIIIYPEEVTGPGLEMVSIHPSFQGRNYTYGYGASITGQGSFERSIAKVNVKTKETVLWNAGDEIIVGEAIFVPNVKGNSYSHILPESNHNSSVGRMISKQVAESEDDGVLIVPSLDLRPDYPDHIYFLNAKTMEEVGRAQFGVRLPPALHGHYLPTS